MNTPRLRLGEAYLISARVRHGQTNWYQVNPSSVWLLTPACGAPRQDMHPQHITTLEPATPALPATPASHATLAPDAPRQAVPHPASKNLEQHAGNAVPRQEVHPGTTCTPAGHAAPTDLDVDVDFSFTIVRKLFANQKSVTRIPKHPDWHKKR